MQKKKKKKLEAVDVLSAQQGVFSLPLLKGYVDKKKKVLTKLRLET